MPGIIKTSSLLNSLLSLLTKDDNEKERREIKRYDDLRFVDANKEIKDQVKKKQKSIEQPIHH